MYEETFNRRAQEYREHALAHADRLVDFLISTTLMARYSLVRGRTSHGIFLAGCKCFFTPPFMHVSDDLYSLAATSFAVGMGLHKIEVSPNAKVSSRALSSLLPPARNMHEVAERIDLWSSIFIVGDSYVCRVFSSLIYMSPSGSLIGRCLWRVRTHPPYRIVYVVYSTCTMHFSHLNVYDQDIKTPWPRPFSHFIDVSTLLSGPQIHMKRIT